MGGKNYRFHSIKLFDYFPHVDPKSMEDGFYERLEALQGVRNTFYAGSLLSFELVSCICAYSKNLVKRFFCDTSKEDTKILTEQNLNEVLIKKSLQDPDFVILSWADESGNIVNRLTYQELLHSAIGISAHIEKTYPYLKKV